MKKALVILALFLLTPFSVSASTIYQQLTDSSGEIDLNTGGTSLIGSFISPTNGVIPSYGGGCNVSPTNVAILTNLALVVGQNTGGTATSSSNFNFYISTSSLGTYPQAQLDWGWFSTSTEDDQFLFPCGYDGINGGTNFIAGTTYYVFKVGNVPGKIRTNLSSHFYYGFLADDGGTSVPIAPGIPGFTDVGISTTSQQVYCYNNFSTSTGFLDSIGQSISTGICNVGVFLFIPSSAAIASWQNLATTTKTRIPFSYMYEVANAALSLTASTTDNFINVAIDMSGWASSTLVTLPQSWVVLSTSTVNQYYPSTMRLLFRGIMASVLYLTFALWVYRKGLTALHRT